MKSRGKLLTGILIGITIGVIVGVTLVLYLPAILVSASSIGWMIVGLVATSIVIVGLLWRGRKVQKDGLLAENSAQNSSDPTDTKKDYAWLVASVLIILAGLVSGFFILRQSTVDKSQAQYQRALIAQQSEKIEAVRIQGMIALMSDVLAEVREEVQENDARNLSDGVIPRIAALSYAFKPYTAFEGDNLTERKLSPERGQLLLALAKLQIDTASWDKILLQVDFSGADLRDANLRGAYLKGIRLRAADLRGANLKGTDLSDADLGSARLWGAILNNAKLYGSNLKRADLRWAELNDANLSGAVLDGAEMTSAIMRRTDLSDASIKYADLSGVFLDEANLTGANLSGAKLNRAHLRHASLNKAILSVAKFNDADLSGAILRDATMTRTDVSGIFVSDKNWMDLLEKWHVAAAVEIKKAYRIVEEDTGGQVGYRLVKEENQN